MELEELKALRDDLLKLAEKYDRIFLDDTVEPREKIHDKWIDLFIVLEHEIWKLTKS